MLVSRVNSQTVASAPPSASAQGLEAPRLRVRITTVDSNHVEHLYTGVATALRSDTLHLSSGGTLRAIPMSTIRVLEISRGRHSRAGTGALVGAVFGLGLSLSVLSVAVAVSGIEGGFYLVSGGVGFLRGPWRTRRPAVPLRAMGRGAGSAVWKPTGPTRKRPD